MKNSFYAFGLFLWVAFVFNASLLGNLLGDTTKVMSSGRPQVCDKDNCVQVEVVSKEADLERGLMFRSNLAANTGMLFLFQDEAIQSFWMKNMHFSLDILWIGKDKRIAYIGHELPACQADPCPVYTPSAKALYVLEVNSDYTLKHHWQVGDQVDILEK